MNVASPRIVFTKSSENSLPSISFEKVGDDRTASRIIKLVEDVLGYRVVRVVCKAVH